MAGPINLLARGYRLEVSANGTTWLRFQGLNDLNPAVTPNNVDSSDYESDGWAASEITMQAWKITAKANRKATAGVEDPAFTLVRSCVGQFGDAARVYVRWYRKDGINEAFSGRAIVEMTPSKTGVADLNEWQLTLTGDGALASITNPYASAEAPVFLGVAPATGAAAGGTLVTITGSGFSGVTGATGVKFATTNASSYTVDGDTVIHAVTPAHAAGIVDVVVTNVTGPSTTGTGAFTYV